MFSIADTTAAVKAAQGDPDQEAEDQAGGEAEPNQTQEVLDEPGEQPPEESTSKDPPIKKTTAQKKTKKNAAQKEPAKRVATRSMSKIPEEQRGEAGKESEVEEVIGRWIEGEGETTERVGRGSGTAEDPVDADKAAEASGTAREKLELRRTMLEMIGQAKSAAAAGNKAEALMFYQVCAGLGGTVTGNQTTAHADTPPVVVTKPKGPSLHPLAIPKPAPAPSLLGIKVPTPMPPSPSRIRNHDEMLSDSQHPDNSVLFDDSAIPTNDDLGFTPFFEKNLVAFRAPLPLTIFNQEWQDKAIIYCADKKSKTDKSSGDKLRYTGYPYPSEYTQTYQEWSVNHQGFYNAISKIPSHANLAVWIVAHKKNADGIIGRHGFMTALRYDIHVRTNALTHRVRLPDGRQSVANISVFRAEIALNMHAKAVRFGEIEFTDNPYAIGCCRALWDPTTGQPVAKKGDQAAKIPLHFQQAHHQSGKGSASGSKPGPDPPKGPSASKDQQGRNGGYKGSRWNPAYHERDNRGHRDGGDSGGGGNGGTGHGGSGGGGGNGGRGRNEGSGKGRGY